MLGLTLGLTNGVCFALQVLQSEPVILVPGLESIPLAGHISVLRDETGQLTFDQVRSADFMPRFTSSDRSQFNYGYTSAAFWFRVALRNPVGMNPPTSLWVMEMSHVLADFIDVYTIRSDGRVESVFTGDKRTAPPELLVSRLFALPLQIEPGEEITLFVRVQNAGPVFFNIHLRSGRGFQANQVKDNLAYGLFFGILLVMVFYNLIVWLWIRDRAYLYYVISLAAGVAIGLFQTGYARQYGDILGEGASIWLCDHWLNIVSVNGLFSALFARTFLQVRTSYPRVDQILFVLVGVWVLDAAVVPFISYAQGTQLMGAIFIIGTMINLAIVLYLSFKGVRAARFLLLAWGVFYVTVISLGLAGFGLLPYNYFTVFGWQIGICLGVTILSLALADRIAIERRDRARFARLKQYLPQSVADLVVEGGDQGLLEPKRRRVTVCVIDLRDFTPFSETSEPEDVMSVLREFFTSMGEIVERHGGTVEHFAGDSMLIFFNAPLEIPEPEKQAVEAALDMRAAFESLWPRWKALGHKLGLGIGLANGYATIGAIGFLGRSQYAAIGAVTNLASRLCSDSGHGEILTTRRVLAEVESLVEFESVGERSIKGFSQPIEVFRLLGAKRQSSLERFESSEPRPITL